jgi:hypothetical protein
MIDFDTESDLFRVTCHASRVTRLEMDANMRPYRFLLTSIARVIR